MGSVSMNHRRTRRSPMMLDTRSCRTRSLAAALGVFVAVAALAIAPGADAALTLQSATNSTLYLMRNEVVDPLFDASQVIAGLYTFPATTQRSIFSWLLAPATYNASYSFTFTVDKPSIVRFGTNVPSSGAVYRPGRPITNLTLDFDCLHAGTSMITFVAVITPTDGSGAAISAPNTITMYFAKTCPFITSCPNGCSGKGTCVVDNTLQEARCSCDPGYESLPDCSLGLKVTPAAVCHGEPFTVEWDSAQLSVGASYNDWIAILVPSPLVPTTWTTALADSISFSSPSGGYLMYSWNYLSLSSAAPEQPITSGSFPVVINDETLSGAFGISFNIADYYQSLAIRSVTVRAKTDATCLTTPAPQNRSDCNNHGTVLGGTCICDSPYFGSRCQSGCAAVTNLTRYGSDFSSSTSDPNSREYLNDQLCAYAITPTSANPNQPVTGVTITFRSSSVEQGVDFISVYKGLGTNESDRVTLLTGTDNLRVVNVPAPTATVIFKTSPWNPSYTLGGGHVQLTGFDATYHATGCTEGSAYAFDTASRTWSCAPCAIGSFSNRMDANACDLCQINSYQSATGQTTCMACDDSEFTPARGASACSECADFGFPEQCIQPEQLTDSQRVALEVIAVLVAFSACVCIFGVWLYRKSRVMVPSSPLLLLIMLFGVIVMAMCCIAIVQLQSVASCKGQIWLLCIGFYCLFGPLIAKTYRLNRIFNAKTLRAVAITDFDLIAAVGALILLDIILLLIWNFVAPPHTSAHGNCSSGSIGFALVLVLLKCGLMGYGVYLTYEIRDIPSAYNESKQIALAFYNIVIIGVLLMCVVFALDLRQRQKIGLQIFGLIWCSAGTMLLIMAPKFYNIFQAPDHSFLPSGFLNAIVPTSHSGGSAPNSHIAGVGRGDSSVGKHVGGGGKPPRQATQESVRGRGASGVGGAGGTMGGAGDSGPSESLTYGQKVERKIQDVTAKRKAELDKIMALQTNVTKLDGDIMKLNFELEWAIANPLWAPPDANELKSEGAGGHGKLGDHKSDRPRGESHDTDRPRNSSVSGNKRTPPPIELGKNSARARADSAESSPTMASSTTSHAAALAIPAMTLLGPQSGSSSTPKANKTGGVLVPEGVPVSSGAPSPTNEPHSPFVARSPDGQHRGLVAAAGGTVTAQVVVDMNEPTSPPPPPPANTDA